MLHQKLTVSIPQLSFLTIQILEMETTVLTELDLLGILMMEPLSQLTFFPPQKIKTTPIQTQEHTTFH